MTGCKTKHEDKLRLLFIQACTTENCVKHLALRKRNPKMKIHVSHRQLKNWECVLTKETQLLAGGFMEWVFIQQQPQGETETTAWTQPGVVFPCQCVMERATGLKKLSDVKTGSMKLVISVTSNAAQQLGNKEKPTLISHLSSENNQVIPKIH